MRPKPWISVLFLAMAAALLITWVEAHSRPRRGILYDTSPSPPAGPSTLILIGHLSPTVTTPIDARNMEPIVPVDSWVAKGQVIGAVGSGPFAQGDAWEPVASPADGWFVASGVSPPSFGIASDPDFLCVHTHVSEADFASIRLGQQALIEIYGAPGTTLHAKVNAIAQTPANSPQGSAYPVTLAVEDAEDMQLAGASVRILFQPELLPSSRPLRIPSR